MKGLKKLNIDKISRDLLLETFKPMFENVICKHITLQYGELSPCFGENVTTAKVVGICASDILQALVVELDGKTKRDDGKIFHITLALAKGVAPKESNAELERIGYESCTPIDVNLELETIVHKK